MGKNQEERKTPVIVVKKRRTFSLPSLSEKTDIIAPVFTEQTAESAPAGINSSAVETHIPEAPARKKKKKRIPKNPNRRRNRKNPRKRKKKSFLLPRRSLHFWRKIPKTSLLTNRQRISCLLNISTALTAESLFMTVKTQTQQRLCSKFQRQTSLLIWQARSKTPQAIGAAYGRTQALSRLPI